jgi:hypothetical protein
LLVTVVPWMQRSMSEQQPFEMFDNNPLNGRLAKAVQSRHIKRAD